MSSLAKRARVLAVVAASLATAAAPDLAHACSGAACDQPEFFPSRGTVPANLPAVLFWPAVDGGEVVAADVRFVRLLDDGSTADVAFRIEPSTEPSTRFSGGRGATAFRVIPTDPLAVGARYALWAATCRDGLATAPPPSPPQATYPSMRSPAPAPYALFEVGPEAPLPTALAPLVASTRVRGPVDIGGGASCAYEGVDAAAVTVAVDDRDSPWWPATAFRTFVDGELYRPVERDFAAPAFGQSWVGRGRDRLVATCEPGPQLLAEGPHEVRLEARVAGTDAVLSTQAVEVELSCAAVEEGAGGCACTNTPRTPAAISLGLLGLAALAGVRRRR